MNKPHVDWAKIICKCRDKFDYKSEAYCFALDQLFGFSTGLILETHRIKETCGLGHSIPHKKPYRAKYNWPSDLNCDDPYYDGVPVF